MPVARTPARLAVSGWDEASRNALLALEGTGAFVACAVGDPSGAALVRARRDTDASCFQQVSRMVRSAEYDAILFADTLPEDDALVAAARGKHLLVLADRAPAEALRATAEAARTHGVPLTLLQPALLEAGLADLPGLVGGDGPHWLDVTIEAPAEADVLLRAAAGHLARLGVFQDVDVLASEWHGRAVLVEVRERLAELREGGRRAVLRVRHAPAVLLRVVAEAPSGVAEVMLRDGVSEVRFTSGVGEELRYRPTDADVDADARDAWGQWAAEAQRAADPLLRDDTLLAEAQGGLLDAIARSVATGEVQAASCCRRPTLRLLEGGGRSEARRGALRLVVS